MTDQAPENTGRTESAAPESRRRSVAKRFGAVLGPLFLFVGFPVALRALLERVPWSGFDEIGTLALVVGISAMVGLLVAGRLRGWYVPGVKELLVALAIVVLSFVALPCILTRGQIERGQHVRMENTAGWSSSRFSPPTPSAPGGENRPCGRRSENTIPPTRTFPSY